MKKIIFCVYIFSLLIACQETKQDMLSSDGSIVEIKAEWRLENVISLNELPASQVVLTLTNETEDTLKNEGWSIYYNDLMGVPEFSQSTSELFFENLAGDFHRLYPGTGFVAIPPGGSRSFALVYTSLPLRQSFGPAGMYVVFDDEAPALLESVITQGINAEKLSVLNPPTPESRYTENESVALLDSDDLPKIIPRPINIVEDKSAVNNLFQHVDIAYRGELVNEAILLKEGLTRSFTGTVSIKPGTIGHISLQIDTSLRADEYTLSIQKSRILIAGGDAAGTLYGAISLLHMTDLATKGEPGARVALPLTEIRDYPRFRYRGLQLDVSRNFHRKEQVLKMLDLMAYYKLNKLHFTITNDEGWRLEIPGIPELTEIGAFRGHTVDESEHLYPAYGSGPYRDPSASYGSGYYTREDYVEILRYARARHIEVIPEIDLPGHARAAIQSMKVRYDKLMEAGDQEGAEEFLLHDPEDNSEYRSAQNYTDNVICVCRESAFRFTEKVIEEVITMHEEAGSPLRILHSGGDEVPYGAWQKSPMCTQLIQQIEGVGHTDELHPYFLRRFKELLDRYGIVTGGWEEIVLKAGVDGHHTTEVNMDMLGQKYLPYVWNSVWGWGREDMAYKLANMGFEIIMCNSSNLYLDMAYNTDPAETGLSWSGYIDTKTVFSYAPENMFAVAETDMYGNPLDPEYIASKTRLTPEGRKNILGIQAEIWSETLRSPELLEYMVFPKLLAFAEKAWAAPATWAADIDKPSQQTLFDADWNEFANMLGQHELPKLNHLFGGVAYRVPLPGANFQDGVLQANVAFPGMQIRFSTVQMEPDQNSSLYEEQVRVPTDTIRLKTFTSTGRSSRTAIVYKK